MLTSYFSGQSVCPEQACALLESMEASCTLRTAQQVQVFAMSAVLVCTCTESVFAIQSQVLENPGPALLRYPEPPLCAKPWASSVTRVTSL